MRSRPWRRAVVSVTAAVGVLGAGACAPPSPAPPTGQPTLTVTTVLGGLNRPWDIAFTGNLMFFTERVGRIAVMVGGTRRVLAQPSDAVAQNEGGMMGIAVDPAYATNRRIYTCFLSNASGSLDVRVVRWQVDSNLTTLSARADLLTGIPVNSGGEAGRHSGCRTRFGPDGYLWVTTGDAATPTVPQSPTSLGGKVLRITTSGAAAPGNPGGPLRAEVYSLGHRNPQGVAFRPENGYPFSIEHGTACDDEVNKLVPGGNYGWYPVPLSGPLFYDESRPMTDPRIAGAIAATWSSGCPTIAPSGGTFLSGAQWKDWNGALAVAVLKGTQLRVFRLDAAGAAVTGQWTAVTDRGRLRVAVQGPDGNLYIATDADPGSILKVVPS